VTFESYDVWLIIGLCALVTYSYRVGGLLLAEHLPQEGPINRALRALPGTILISLVAPGVLDAGPWGLAGAGLTALVLIISKNVFLAMLAGVVLVALSRNLG
jgi:uncharacterized membrane protein